MKVLFRKSLADEGEFEVASKYFDVVEHRTECSSELVIPRYSALPYYKELETDLVNHGCMLINSYAQHRWIAEFEWHNYLREFTPKTYFDQNIAYAPEGRYVVKGRTNSRKAQWNSLMFAQTRGQALGIAAELASDPFIGPQGIVYREFVELETFDYGLNDLPFTNEFRFFLYQDKVLAWDYYWSIAPDEVLQKAHIEPEAFALVQKLAEIVQQHVNFYVLDVAQKKDGSWILVEVNDGSMSGLSCVDPHDLYKHLKAYV